MPQSLGDVDGVDVSRSKAAPEQLKHNVVARPLKIYTANSLRLLAPSALRADVCLGRTRLRRRVLLLTALNAEAY